MDKKILKIGGSVFTQKNGLAQLDTSMVQTAAMEIARWLREDQQRRLIFTTGGGSFGHPIAIKYNLNATEVEKSDEGFLLTNMAMRDLADQVTVIFQTNGVPLYPITTSNIFITNRGRIQSASLETLTLSLKRGLVPFLCGDVTHDTDHTYRILSADQINSYLYKHLDLDVMLFGSNVDGIFSDDPSINPGAVWIPIINPENYGHIHEILSSSPHKDATRAMLGKLEEIYEVKKRPVNALIYNATLPGNTYRALSGELFGTQLIF